MFITCVIFYEVVKDGLTRGVEISQRSVQSRYHRVHRRTSHQDSTRGDGGESRLIGERERENPPDTTKRGVGRTTKNTLLMKHGLELIISKPIVTLVVGDTTIEDVNNINALP